MLQDSLQALLKVVFLVFEKIIKEADKIISQDKVSRRVTKEDQILFGGLITFLPVIVELEHGAHVASASLLILSVR